MKFKTMSRKCAYLAVLAILPGAARAADQFSTLASFTTATGPQHPLGNIVVDNKGNIFGVTYKGGAKATGLPTPGDTGRGTIYELSPPATGQTAWTETILWDFTAKHQGGNPVGGLVRDKSGNLYGTLIAHGTSNCGAAFRLKHGTTGWHLKILWNFQGGTADGCMPASALIFDAAGNLYGTSQAGGTNDAGTAFKLVPPATGDGAWTESVIWNFPNNGITSPQYTTSQLIFDTTGNLYVMSYYPGNDYAGNGTAWQLVPPAAGGTGWTQNTLWTFDNSICGEPLGQMQFDRGGNLYGICHAGGTHNNGAVFELSPPASGATAWTPSVLYNFTDSLDGAYPIGGVTLTQRGTLLVPTEEYGKRRGTLTELSPPSSVGGAWQADALINFGGEIGLQADTPVVVGPKGNIFGTTYHGAVSTNLYGIVWELQR